jgi:outer membrane murein-binding lipoprotein Lpp
MKTLTYLTATIAVLTSLVSMAGCSTEAVGDTRQSGVERRQDRIDARTSARQDRWQERGEREDARAKARFDSW